MTVPTGIVGVPSAGESGVPPGGEIGAPSGATCESDCDVSCGSSCKGDCSVLSWLSGDCRGDCSESSRLSGWSQFSVCDPKCMAQAGYQESDVEAVFVFFPIPMDKGNEDLSENIHRPLNKQILMKEKF